MKTLPEQHHAESYVVKLPKRTGIVKVIEEPTRIVFQLRLDKYGVFGDEAELSDWLLHILEKYDTDKRPIVMDNPTTGEIATVFGDASSSFVCVKIKEP